MNQPLLFDNWHINLPRRPNRKLMHVCDASVDCESGEKQLVQMRCNRCGHESEWIELMTTEAKRGIPCPKFSE